MSPPLSGSGAECSGRVHGGPSGTDRDGLGRRVHDPGRIGPRPRADRPTAPGALRPHRIPTLALREDRSGRRTGSARQFPHDSAVPTKQPSSAGWNDPPGAPLPAPAPGIRDRSAPTTRRTAWTERRPRTQRHPREPQGRRQPVYYAPSPPLRPFTLRYAPLPRTVKGQGAKQSKRGAADEPPGPESATPSGPAHGAALDATGPAAHGDAPVRRHRVRDDPGQCGLDRGGVSRVWARAGPGVARGRRAPSPACVMRAQRNRIHPASRRASPARRNPPALDPRRLTSHNASPGDITKSTPPASPRRTPVDRPGDAGAGGGDGRRGPRRRGVASPPRRSSPASGGALRRRPHAGRRGAPSPASGGALRGGPLPVCSASPGPRQAEPSRRRTTPTVLSRIIRSMTGVQFST